MKTKLFLSSILVMGMLTFTSCFEPIYITPFGNGSGGGVGGSWPDYTITEESQVQPGALWADSSVYVGQDSIKLFGHFSSFATVNRKAIIDYVYFEMTSNWGDYVIDTVVQNVEWNLHNIDTTTSFVAIVPAMDVPTNVYFSLHMRVANNLPEPHQQEKYWYYSFSNTIQEFVIPTSAVQDSVTFVGSDKAVLWAHLETELDCEIMHAGFEWHEMDEPPVYDTIAAPQYLMRDKLIQLRDTVSIKPNTLYYWRFFAQVKYSGGSVSIVKGFKNTFRKNSN
jgi:hypothetical protein